MADPATIEIADWRGGGKGNGGFFLFYDAVE
jgi:hypothetical protein